MKAYKNGDHCSTYFEYYFNTETITSPVMDDTYLSPRGINCIFNIRLQAVASGCDTLSMDACLSSKSLIVLIE